ncbi:MAG TPA: sulfite exporter TauE/SafE family protein [Candidatus Pacearchaeota archaeon]|nr:sulfite exporter TauE/SafE family protein [Candidatus Pacearchaeota archaeon]HPR79954.1 sulfite exporter TauE/SafE family protein [Candidatus Pacearchaeota archaeon]
MSPYIHLNTKQILRQLPNILNLGYNQNMIEQFLTAILMGILINIDICPLMANLAAITYISKNSKKKSIIMHGLFYSLGRILSYTIIALLVYFGLSSFHFSFLTKYGEIIAGIILIISGITMFILANKDDENEKEIKNIPSRGYFGSFSLGAILSLAFCPHSAALFFGILIPLTIKSAVGLLLPPFFAIGASLPIIILSFFLSYNTEKIDIVFNKMEKVEKPLRYTTALIFLITGIIFIFN